MIRELDINNQDEIDQWNALVENSDTGTAFHHASWLLGLRRYLEQNILLYGIYDEGDLVGGIAVSEYRKYGLRGVRRPFGTPHNHPIFLSSLEKKRAQNELNSLFQFLVKRYHYVAITSFYQADPLVSLMMNPVRMLKKSTILLEIDNSDQLWMKLNTRLRNEIRKVMKSGILIQKAESYEEFYVQYVETFRRQGRHVPFSSQQFSDFCRHLVTSRIADVYEARDDHGRLHASAMIMYDAKRAYYSFAASHPELRKSRANVLLLWEVIKTIAPQYPVFDMVGANLPAITRFKLRFGGEIVDYTEYLYSSNIILQTIAGIYLRCR